MAQMVQPHTKSSQGSVPKLLEKMFSFRKKKVTPNAQAPISVTSTKTMPYDPCNLQDEWMIKPNSMLKTCPKSLICKHLRVRLCIISIYWCVL